MLDNVLFFGGIIVGAIVFLTIVYNCLGLVIIGEKQVGIVTKKFGTKTLSNDSIIALNGESGVQAKTLSPGLHFFYFFWQYSIEKVPLVEIEPGKIGLIMAIDGKAIPSNRLLGRIVDCNNFQDAEAFLKNNGQKGKQLGILTSGSYRINTKLFEVSVTDVIKIETNNIGIITTLDGAPLEPGEIAGNIIPDHNNFQDPQTFLDNGGKRGLQEQVILAGQWNLNPWFVSVKYQAMFNIPIGNVGVVTSYVGKKHEDVTGDSFKHGDLVQQGHKGVCVDPLHPGMYPINPYTTKIDIVPTTNVVLNWAENRNEAHKLDQNLSSITVRSKDGFSYNLDVSVIIHIGIKEAARVITRTGSMQGLISQVLEPAIANYFRNSAQEFAALDFLKQRTEMQKNAAKFVREALVAYDVEAVDTLIGDIVLPSNLLETQTQRKLAEEMKQTYLVQQESEKQKEALNRQVATTQQQSNMVQTELQVKISQLQAEQKVKTAEGETKIIEQQALQKIKTAEAEAQSVKLRAVAEAERIEKTAAAEATGISAKGKAQATAYTDGVKAMGEQNYTMLQTMSVIAKEKLKVIPDLVVNGGNGDNSGGGMALFNVMMAQMLKDKISLNKPQTPESQG